MIKHLKKATAILLTLLMVTTTILALPFTASAAEVTEESVGETSGTTGKCTWTLENGVLTISGNGAMGNYSSGSKAPWKNYSFTEAVIEDGVTSIGEYSFYYSSIISITIADSVSRIGDHAFYACKKLTSIIIPDSVTNIGESAFSYCSKLTNVNIPNGVTSIGKTMFYCCGLTSIVIPYSVTSIGKDAFKFCKSIAEIKVDERNEKFDSRNNCNAIIETESNTLVMGCKNTVIPNTVKNIGDGSFLECSNLISIIIPDTVTNIGDNAFEYCISLTSVIIPDTVTNIGDNAFSNCKSLTSIIIPGSVTKIGNMAFYMCENLTSVKIQDGLTDIGWNAFMYCTSLTGINIPKSVTSIGHDAFSRCNGLTNISVDEENSFYDSRNNCNAIIETRSNSLIRGCNNTIIPDSVNEIGDNAFIGCSNLTNVAIPNSVTKIGICAFQECTSLESIKIPDSVTIISGSAFSGCTGLESITIPDSVTIIEPNAFSYCGYLNDVTIPKSVRYIGFDAFANSILTIHGSRNTYAESYANSNNIPFVALEKTTASGVTGDCTWLIYEDGVMIISGNGDMENYSFDFAAPWKSYDFSKVLVKDGVTSVGDYAFCDCENLSAIYLPSSITDIGDYAFSNCTNLSSIIIPDSVTYIESNTFNNCTNLTFYGYINSYAEIYSESNNISFEAIYNYGVTGDCIWRLSEEDTLTISGNGAMYDYSADISAPWEGLSFSKAVIEDGVTNLGSHAFGCCGSLTDVTINDSVTDIGECAFVNCSSLTNVAMSENITRIGQSAFGGCSNLASLSIPNNVTSIDEGTFSRCASLKNINIPSGVTSIGNCAFYECTNLEIATIPNSVISIGQSAFSYCKNLSDIIIPDSVTSIGVDAFWDCERLTSITIPDRVTEIGKSAFAYCKNMSSITVSEGNEKYDSRNNCNAIIETASNTLIQGCNNTVIPDGVTSINDYAFAGCIEFTSATIPESVTKICNSAFSKCGFTNITIPNSVTNIESCAFQGCENLLSIDLPDSITKISGWTFHACSSLNGIVIPKNVTSIGQWAFRNCTGLAVITMPDNLTDIGYKAFEGTKWLNNQSEGVVYAGSAACDYKVGSTTPEPDVITLKPGTVSITQGAFFGCNIESIIIPNTVTKIGSYAFANCTSLKSVTIPPSVKSIGKKAFGYCLDNGTINDFLNFDEMEFKILKFTDNDNKGISILGTKNSAAEKYANSEQEFTFKESDIYDYTFSWGTDNWGFNNTKDSVKGASIDKDTVKKLAGIFHIENINDLNTLETKLDNISKKDWTYWPGSCFGMTVAEILVKQGLLSLSDYGVGNISNALPTDKNKLITLISVLSELQNCGYYATARRSRALSTENSSSTTDEGSQNSDTTSITQKNFIKKIEEELKTVENEEEAKKNHSVILIEYAYKNPNNNIKHHTVLGYGIESGEYEYNGKTYEHRILIADPNKLSQNGLYDNACIYYHYKDDEDNEDYDRWICPYQNDNNGKCYYNGNESDPGQIKLLIKYNSLTDPEFYPEVSKDYYIAGLTIFNDIENLTVGEGITDYPISDQLDDRKLYAFDNTKECSFSYTTPSDYSMMVDYENISYYANVENGTSTTMNPSGYINLKSDDNNKKINYSITMMTDDSERVTDWSSITVSGNNTNDVTLKKDNGYILSSDNLQNIEIKAKNSNVEAIKTFSATYNSVFIYEIDENTIGIKVDVDGDGTYETELSDVQSTYQIGDVNLNGVVDINDVTAIQLYLAELEPLKDNQLAFADVDGNGAFDINDATQLQKNLAGLTG